MAELEGFERGLEPREQTAPLPGPDSASVEVDFSLRSLRPIAITIHGTVTEAAGSPLPNATVTAQEGRLSFRTVMGTTTTDSTGTYRMVVDDHCAVAADSCYVSLQVRAAMGTRSEGRFFADLDVPGDSLELMIEFNNLR